MVSKVVLLGTGTPNAEVDKSGPSVAIVAGGNAYLVDFGPGVVRRAKAAFELGLHKHRSDKVIEGKEIGDSGIEGIEIGKSGIEGMEISKLRVAFVTHLHSDHTAGYPDIILTPWVLGRDEPLEVYGPKGIAKMTDHVLKAYGEDIRERVEGLQPSNEKGWRVVAHEIEEGLVYEDKNVKVKAFRGRHGGLDAYGYRFDTGDRVITVSGDTSPYDGIAGKYKGSDVLVHEVYSSEGFKRYPSEWQRYHKAMHTSSTELAEIASEAMPGLLVLYHQLYNGVSDEELVAEVRSGYDGEVVSGRDGDVF